MSRLMNAILAGSALPFALLVSTAALAQAVPSTVGAHATAGSYSLTMAEGAIFAQGTVTTNSDGHAVAIMGLVNGTDTITGLSTYAGADNDLYSTGSWVTFGGLSFSTTTLGDFNFFNSGLGYYGLLSSRIDINGVPNGLVAAAHVAAIPEPATWCLMLSGYLVAGLGIRRIRRPAFRSQAA